MAEEKSERIRLVITALVPEPAGRGGKTGGAVRLIEVLKRIEAGKRIGILIICPPFLCGYFRGRDVLAEYRIINSKLKYKSLLGLCIKSLLIIAKSFFVLKLDFLEKEGGKVIVYAASDLFWEVIPAFFYKTRNKKIEWVQVIHHVYPDWKKRPGSKAVNFFGFYLQRFSFWLIRKKADRIILVSDFVRKELADLGFPQNRMLISSNGVDTEYFENIRKAKTGYDGIFLARLNRSKGTSDLIEIWKKVCNELPQARLAVIGGGDEAAKNFLAEKIRKYNLENNIDLLGFLEDREAYQILKSGKVFLFPSHEEGWGIAIAEAMACGLPVVSWDLPVYDAVFGDNISQAEEGNVKDFSEKVIKFLKNENFRSERGVKNSDFIKKYSWDKVAKIEYEAITGV